MKAYVFPGQGSQYPKMGKDLLEKYPIAKEILDKSNTILDFNLSETMIKGEEIELKKTIIAQLSIFLYSYIQWQSITKPKKYVVAGHSLGEYSALVAIGALEFEDALKLIKKRAQFMNDACLENDGKMLAVIGVDKVIIENTCLEISKTLNFTKNPFVTIANYNSYEQIIVSGNELGIELAKKEFTKYENSKLIELKVQGAFHTIMMNKAKINFSKELKNINIINTKYAIYQNVDSMPHKNHIEIKNNLDQQIVKPVLWLQTITNIINDGYTEFEEIGPGKVLTKLVKRIQNNNFSYNRI